MKKNEYYSLDNILKTNADYYVIFGERSNGKTTAVLSYALKEFCQSGYKNQCALIRRFEEDYKGKNGSSMCNTLVSLNMVKEYTKNEYNNIIYFSQRWFLCYTNENGDKIKQCEQPFLTGFAISSEEHYKSTSYPNIKNVLFDEFITRSFYLVDEFIKFQNLLSTIIRNRDDVKIFMCGNTINQYCIYFKEMGLTNIKKMDKGTIDIYSYGESELKVAVEFSDFKGKKKKSNKYFAFNNPKLEMIKSGAWEMDIYPHLPVKYTPKDIAYIYFINFEETLLQCEIIFVENTSFTYIHKKTTPIQKDNVNIVYQKEYSELRNYRRNLLKPMSKTEQKILSYFQKDKVFYQDNELGELVRNYLNWCKQQ